RRTLPIVTNAPPKPPPLAWIDPMLDKRPALEGEYARIRNLLDRHKEVEALRAAIAYRDRKPADELAWLSLGDSYLASGDLKKAARAYGSLLDIDAGRAEKQRAAGGWLEALAQHAESVDAEAAKHLRALATGAYRRALERRPDHPSGHRLLAFALAREGSFSGAFDVLERACSQSFAPRFGNARMLLLDDLALMGGA